jgi:hypothetical protein
MPDPSSFLFNVMLLWPFHWVKHKNPSENDGDQVMVDVGNETDLSSSDTSPKIPMDSTIVLLSTKKANSINHSSFTLQTEKQKTKSNSKASTSKSSTPTTTNLFLLYIITKIIFYLLSQPLSVLQQQCNQLFILTTIIIFSQNKNHPPNKTSIELRSLLRAGYLERIPLCSLK